MRHHSQSDSAEPNLSHVPSDHHTRDTGRLTGGLDSAPASRETPGLFRPMFHPLATQPYHRPAPMHITIQGTKIATQGTQPRPAPLAKRSSRWRPGGGGGGRTGQGESRRDAAKELAADNPCRQRAAVGPLLLRIFFPTPPIPRSGPLCQGKGRPRDLRDPAQS